MKDRRRHDQGPNERTLDTDAAHDSAKGRGKSSPRYGAAERAVLPGRICGESRRRVSTCARDTSESETLAHGLEMA